MASRRPHSLSPEQYLVPRRYFLTLCAHNRRRHFLQPVVVDLVTLHLLRTAVEHRVEILAYCIMPDHLHAVVTTPGTCDLRQVVSQVKQRSGFAFSRLRGERLWQRGYFDRAIRVDEDVRAVVAYVLNNPIRAGIVERLTDYAHWGASAFSREALVEFLQSSPTG